MPFERGKKTSGSKKKIGLRYFKICLTYFFEEKR